MPSTRSKDRELIATTSSLVEFLRDVALARRRRINDVAEYDLVLWIDDLPNEISVNVEAGPGETLFAIPRLRAEAPPEPPAALTNWLDKDSVTNSGAASPVLKPKGPAWVVVKNPDGSKGMAAKTLPLKDAPDVGRSFEAWLPQWHAWAARDRRAEPFRRWYNQLASAAHASLQQEEQFEVVLGTGLLAWKTPGGVALRNHVITSRLLVVVDAETDEVRVVVDPEQTTRFQDRELLDGVAGYDPVRVENLHDQVRDEAVAQPLIDCEPLAKAWADRALDVETPFIAEWAPAPKAETSAEVRLAPAVILRKRERASLIGYYDAMLHALRGRDAQAPLGLAQLVTSMEAGERLAWLAEEGAASGEMLGADPLFPLPANPEQMRIMDRLRSNNGVVVQGPPGTGKTHTIANLISALLAQGQRVLVTSQKAQALRVLRDKLPAEVAKLCVSVTDLDRGGSSELEGSVKAMSNRYAGFDAAAHATEIARAEAKRAQLRARAAELTDAVRELREAETVEHDAGVPGYQGTLGEIARRLHDGAERYDWMPALPATGEIDLTGAELAQLRRLLSAQTPERVDRVNQRPVDTAAYPSADELRAMIDAEKAAIATAKKGATDVSRRLDGASTDVLRALATDVDNGRHYAALLGLPGDARAWDNDHDWAVRGVSDGMGGNNSMLWQQLAAGEASLAAAGQAMAELGFRQVLIGPGAPGSAGARLTKVSTLRDHLREGGKLRGGLLKSKEQREAEPVLEHATVDGDAITEPEQVELVALALTAQAAVENLARGWAMVGADAAVRPGEAVHQSVARVVDLYKRLRLVNKILGVVNDVRKALATTQAWLPLTNLTEWQEFVDALGGVRLRIDAENATAALAEVEERLQVDARPADSPPELTRASAAVAARNAAGYAEAITRLADVAQEQTEQATCAALLGRLRAQHPTLAQQLERDPDDSRWAIRFADFEAAVHWGRAFAYFSGHRQAGREQQLEAELADTIARIGQETAELAAAKAWNHCLTRMTAHQAQALQAYEQHMRNVGKGTGRYAAKYRSDAREAMREARDAVPAWIMPLDVVLETLAPVRDSFDVVIVDEASQASLEDLFLLWLAPRVIVVGDDKQCAPSQVRLGELEPIFAKLTSYLPELPGYLRDAYTPRSSLFDLLRTRFGAVIPLREHFRCMPEIIEFSSRQFYADEPLVPLRQFGGDRLPPLRSVRVKKAKTEGSSTRLRNPVEAAAVVAQIEACIADPAYAGKTFGVVVLQGTGQVQTIHQLLLEKIEPKEWERRRLRVGTPPDFQGDERDVIFVSMVVAEKRAAVTGTEWQRRFNVAASRAKDQMWLFHSVGPESLTPNDLRASLLGYVLNPPPALATGAPVDVSPDEPHPAFGSLFQQRVYLNLAAKGFHVTPSVEVNGREIDLVVTGAKGRLAVECDGQLWAGTLEQRLGDLDRERELKRAGWRFWRVRESEFAFNPEAALTTLWSTLDRLEIEPVGTTPVAAPTSTVWAPAQLSSVEGLDGLDAADSPEELDAVTLTA